MSNLQHLSPEAASVIGRPIEERIAFMAKPYWLEYPLAKAHIEYLRELVLGPRIDRMPCALIFGPSNAGKSSLKAQLIRSFTHQSGPTSGKDISNPILAVQAPPLADEARLLQEILRALHAPMGRSCSARELYHQVRFQLGGSGTQVLIIDEFHHLILGTPTQQRTCMNAIKGLSTVLQISIVGVGLPEAFHAINSSPQLDNRFLPLPLPRWSHDENFRQLLSRLETRIPLPNPSDLGSAQIARIIHMKTSGLLGEVITLLRMAGIFAIKNGLSSITRAALGDCRYKGPDERRAEFLKSSA